MPDQAEKLRELVRSKASETVPDTAARLETRPMAPVRRKARVLTITSGKGGVGKTNVATNLAIELALMGKQVTVFDADLSLANIDVLLGLRPAYNLNHVVSGERTLQEVIVEGPHHVRVVPASSGVQALADLTREQLNRLTGQFAQLERSCDFLIIDTGAGISDNVMCFLHAADQILVVTTPEPTAYTDAYALIKVVSEQNTDSEIGLIVNMAQNRREARQAAEGIIMVSRKFLQVDVKDYGYLLRDPEVPRATRRQEAFSLYNPSAPASRGVRALAARLVQDEPAPGRKGVFGLLERVAAYFSG
jgi:flagellar biosynthesis protein FlhG